jgi:IclR family KDG regulon transcriptional repressor
VSGSEDKKQSKSAVPALDRILRILDIISEKHAPTAFDIIKESGIARSSAYILINELKRQGFIRQDEDGRLHLWMRLIHLGKSAEHDLELRPLVIKPMEKLVEETKSYSSDFGLFDGNRGYYACRFVNPDAGLFSNLREGSEISLVRAGLGKCLLAFQPSEIQSKIMDKLDYIPVTPTSITSPEALKKDLALIRERGWSIGYGEQEYANCSICVPVFNRDRSLFGAVSVIFSRQLVNDEYINNVLAHLKTCAKDVEERLSARG